MRLTDAELQRLQRDNPELQVQDDGTRTTIRVSAQPRAAIRLSEFDLQKLVFEECARRALKDDRWCDIYANVNGQYRKGQRPEPGLKRGVPDIFVAVPSGPYAGMYLELKVSPNKPSREQLEWIQRLRKRGYCVEVIWDSVDEVIKAISDYLEGL